MYRERKERREKREEKKREEGWVSDMNDAIVIHT
jgi:hypothetical protein